MIGAFRRRRQLTLIGVYAAIMLVVLTLIPKWHELDVAFLGVLNGLNPPAFDRRLVVVDVRYENQPSENALTHAKLWDDLGFVLSRVAQEATQHRAASGVVVDAHVIERPSEQASHSREYAHMLSSLRALASLPEPEPVFLALPSVPALSAGAQVDPQIYGDLGAPGTARGTLSGFGHTDFTVIDGVTNVAFYDECKTADEHQIAFLPLVALGGFSACDDSAPRILMLGRDAEFADATVRFDRSKADRGITNGSLAGKWVLVASPRQDPNARFVAWAISDLLAKRDINARLLKPLPDVSIEVAMLVLLSVSTSLTYGALFGKLRRFGQARWWMSLAGSVVAGAALEAGAVWVLYDLDILYPQVSLPFAGICVAGALCSVRGRQRLWEQTFTHDLQNIQALLAKASVTYDVFISYSHAGENARWVRDNLVDPLRRHRLNVFFDQSSIEVGMAWYAKMLQSLSGSRFVIPVYTADYFTRPYCETEMLIAGAKWSKQHDAVLPLMRGRVAVPDWCAHIAFLSTEQNPDAAGAIIDLIVKGVTS
jgi:hypothetical protein